MTIKQALAMQPEDRAYYEGQLSKFERAAAVHQEMTE